MGSSQILRAIATSVAVAGLTYGALDQLGVSQTSLALTDSLQRSAVQNGLSSSLALMTHEMDFREVLRQGLINIPVSAFGGYLANQIGELRFPLSPNATPISWMEHKLLHGLLGAAMGSALDLKYPGKGAIGGAMGAV